VNQGSIVPCVAIVQADSGHDAIVAGVLTETQKVSVARMMPTKISPMPRKFVLDKVTVEKIKERNGSSSV
jgi:hypothetical protein